MKAAGHWRRWAAMLCAIIAAGSCARTPAAGRYGQAVQALRAGSSADYYGQIIALAHQAPNGRAGRRARAILCSGSGPLDVLLTRAQASAVDVGVGAAAGGRGLEGPSPPAPVGVDPQAQAQAQAEAVVEVHQVLGELAQLQAKFHAAHGRYCHDFLECPLTLPPRPHYFYFLSDQAVVGGSDSELTVESEPDIRAWMVAQKLRPASSHRSYLAVAVGLLGQNRVDVWTLNQHGRIEPFGRRGPR